MSGTATGSVLTPLIDAWSRCCDDVLSLGGSLDEADAARPTDLPGWSVHDVLAHLAALEAELAGDEPLPAPDAALPADALGDPFRVHMERGVAARRGRSLDEVLRELAAAVDRRRDQLAASPPTDPAEQSRGIGGSRWTWETLLRNRVVDLWMHEQDVRRAVDQPGGWDSPGAQITVAGFVAALPFVLGRKVRPAPGTTVRWRVGGEDESWQVTVRMEDDGRARVADEESSADVEILLTVEQFVLACGGRRPVESINPALAGETDLGRRVVAAMAVTP